MKKVLVTGGAGYIGSFVNKGLKEKGYEVVVLDDMSSGHEKVVEEFRLEKLNLVNDFEKLRNLLKEEKFDGVIHMASFIQMGESYKNPGKYYRNNVIGFLNLLDALVESGGGKVILSSSAGVYGNPVNLPIKEDDSKNPLNPYGETKYIMERILSDYDDAFGIKSISIRYFNAAGAALDGSMGENHPEESHLLPNIIKRAINSEEIQIFGDDYNTPDGTNVRDYIHVLDLVDNHILSLEALLNGANTNIYNAGAGKGYSNKEILAEVEKVTGLKLNIKYLPRRPGDADSLYASIDKIKNDLGWSPKYGLTEIIQSAYLWHKNNPDGYR